MTRRNEIGFSRGRETGLSTYKTIAALRELGEHVLEAAKAALKEGVDEVVADAKSRCPVKTGALKNSIRAEPNREGTSYKIVADADNNGFCYGVVVEFSPKINKPFLYPALEANYGRIMGNIRTAINQAVQTGHA